jgi:hypothetical protein
VVRMVEDVLNRHAFESHADLRTLWLSTLGAERGNAMLHGISAEAFWMLAALPEWLVQHVVRRSARVGFFARPSSCTSWAFHRREMGRCPCRPILDRVRQGVVRLHEGQTRYSFCVLPWAATSRCSGRRTSWLPSPAS